MKEIPQTIGLHSPSLVLYAFHLRNSINQGLKPTSKAPQLWEQLVDLGNKLNIPELQNLQQQLISYQNNQYFPAAEDNLESEYEILLPNQQTKLDFEITSKSGDRQLQGLLCPYRVHDTYAIDFTLHSQSTFFLSQLAQLNPQYLLLPSQIQASLGQTLLLFGQPSELQENYQDFADACVTKLLPTTNRTELINTGHLLGNPIFEYESRHKDPSQRLHILVWLKCQNLDPEEKKMDKASELMLLLLWCRHKIQYIYHQSRGCEGQLKQLYSKIEQHKKSFGQISRSPNRQEQLRPLLVELQDIDIKYTGYLEELEAHKNTIATNEKNYRMKVEKLGELPDTDLSLWENFLNYIRKKLQSQIQADLEFLSPKRAHLQNLKAAIKENLTQTPSGNKTRGITDELRHQLYKALLECDQFETNQELKSFFKGQARLSPWANSLPEGKNTAQRVTLVIGFLVNRYRRDTNENVLVILVNSLSSTIDPADTRNQTLSELAEKLKYCL